MLALFSSLLQAEDITSEKYCFSSTEEFLIAQKKISTLQVPSDSVVKDENCIMFHMKSHRFELIHRYITTNFPNVSIPFSSAAQRTDPCLLQVEKIKEKKSENLEASAGQVVSANQEDTSAKDTEISQIQTLKEFELTLDQNQIKGECRFINSSRYEITIKVAKNPKPVLPVSIVNGVMVQPAQNPPPNQETMNLQTQIQINKGEKIEIGSIVKKIQNEENLKDVQTGIDYKTNEGQVTEKIFLSLQ